MSRFPSFFRLPASDSHKISLRRRRDRRSLRLESLESRMVMTSNLTFAGAILDNTGGTMGLAAATAATVSPDGGHVYAVSEGDHALSVFHRDPTSGELTFIEMHQDDVNGVDGLRRGEDVVVSPDGKTVYVAASLDDAISVFARDTVSGRLQFIQVLKDDIDGIDGLQAASSVTVSADGKSVYAAGPLDSAVAVFGRDQTTGLLSQVEVQYHGNDPNDPALLGASDVIVSEDGQNVYAVAALSSSINVFSRNQTTGELSLVDVLIDEDEPQGTPGVQGMRGARELALSPDGDNVYVASPGDTALAVFSRGGGGGLSFVEYHRDGVNGVDGLVEGWSLVVSGDGQHVYLASRQDASLALFSREASGSLDFVELVQDNTNGVDGLNTVLSVAISPDGRHVYAVGEHSIPLFRRSVATGELTFVELQTNGIDMVDGLDGAFSVAVSPDGRNVYTVSRQHDHSVSVFLRDSVGLTFMQVLKNGVDGVDGLNNASDVTVSPDGNQVYITSEAQDSISVYDRDASTGVLTFSQTLQNDVGGVAGMRDARAVEVSADGQHVYVAAGSSLVVFNRDAGSGQLTFVEANSDGTDGITGLIGVRDLTISADGKQVYAVAAGSISSGLSIFHRNAMTGELTFDRVLRDGVDGVDGLASSWGIHSSSDGKSVYVSSPIDHSVALFERDPSTGDLTYIELLRDGENGVDGLLGAQKVTVSPDGKSVFVTAGALFIDDQGLAVFDRDQTTGRLTFVEAFKNGVGQTSKLLLARGVAVSPDGENVFVVSAADDALNVFHRAVASPETFIVSAPAAISDSTDATFDFSSDQSPVTYQCSLDGAGFVDCTDSVTFTGLSEGEHTLEVRAIDQAGNIDPTPATYTWTIDLSSSAAPRLLAFSTSSPEVGGAVRGQVVTASGSFEDINPGDVHQVLIDWKDGHTSLASVDQAAGTFTATHVFATGGVFDVSATVSDDGGLSDSLTAVAAIGGVRLTSDGRLQIVGTDAVDKVNITEKTVGALRVVAKFDVQNITPLGNETHTFSTADVQMIEMYLGDGDDVGKLAGAIAVNAVIHGDEGNDNLGGGAGDDELYGGAGNDKLTSGNGDDLLDGGAGDDTLTAGNGDDIAVGGAGDDVINGGGGNDAIDGGEGNDNLRGGGGNDVLRGGDGVDFLDGEGGNDIVLGGAGDDVLEGGSGRDLLIGGMGADAIAGEAGDDVLIDGRTTHDDDDAALAAILAAWTAPGNYTTRVSNLRAMHLTAAAVLHDAAIDQLTGGKNLDWFWCDLGQDVTDLASNEFAN